MPVLLLDGLDVASSVLHLLLLYCGTFNPPIGEFLWCNFSNQKLFVYFFLSSRLLESSCICTALSVVFIFPGGISPWRALAWNHFQESV